MLGEHEVKTLNSPISLSLLIFCFSLKGWEEEYELSLGHALHQGHGADGAFSLLTNLNSKNIFGNKPNMESKNIM